MNNTALLEELAYGLTLGPDQASLHKINYDTIPVNKIFAVKLKTGSYSILRKTAQFDDEVLEATESYENTIAFLKSKS